MTGVSLDTKFDAEAVRRDFPILEKPLPGGMKLVYLDNAATAQKPRQVVEKLAECLENYTANVHRGIHALGDRITIELEEAREKGRQFVVAAEVEENNLISGTTISTNLVSNSLG